MGRHGTIANRKSAQDSKRSAMFTKYSRQIIVAAKGGGDPEFNPSLRVAIDKAKSIGMPNDNINRAIKKGTGELGGESYDELQFEGYGPSGVAVIVEALTDNMFSRAGVIIIDSEDLDEDEVMEIALEAGADDMIVNEDNFEIRTEPSAFNEVHQAIKDAGFEIVEAEVEQIPSMEANVTDESAIKSLTKLITSLEDNDDVQKVYFNCDLDLD